jgi:hypothetical protein
MDPFGTAPGPIPPLLSDAAQSTPQLTAEELAELRALRAERAERLERERIDAEEAAARLSPASHYVHLADGSIVEGSQLGTHHSTGDGTGHPRGDRVVAVAACYPK